MNYSPSFKKTQLILGSGFPIIVCGWFPRKKIQELFRMSDYAAAGSLFSKSLGLNLLLKNLILNPLYTEILAISITKADSNSGSIDSLEDFFVRGYEKSSEIDPLSKESYQVVKNRSFLTANVYLDSDIPTSYLDGLRDNIDFKRFYDLNDLIEYIEKKRKDKIDFAKKKPWHQDNKISFAKFDNKQKERVLCNPGQIVRCNDLKKGWINLIELILNGGTDRPTRHGGKVREVLNVVTVIDSNKAKETCCVSPNDNYLPVSQVELDNYIKDSLYSEDINKAQNDCNPYYTYSDRINSWFGCDQIDLVKRNLQKDPNNNAIVNLWDVGYDTSSEEPPCLNHLAFRIQSEKLFLTATFRSQDIFRAWFMNASALMDLQQKVVKKLGFLTTLGSLTIISQSAHIYDDCLIYGENSLKKFNQTNRSTSLIEDCVGNYIILINENKEIEVSREKDGRIVSEYIGKSLIKLYKQIVRDAPGIDPEHALYLGTELQKASLAIAENKLYVQDRKFKTFVSRPL